MHKRVREKDINKKELEEDYRQLDEDFGSTDYETIFLVIAVIITVTTLLTLVIATN